jgi:hypothetical protein
LNSAFQNSCKKITFRLLTGWANCNRPIFVLMSSNTWLDNSHCVIPFVSEGVVPVTREDGIAAVLLRLSDGFQWEYYDFQGKDNVTGLARRNANVFSCSSQWA